MHQHTRKLVFLSVLTLAIPGLLLAADDPPAKRMNVVMVEADDLNPMALGYMGHPVARTPNLDRLAAEGTVFTNCIVQGTACAPSRNSLISGTYPHNTGIYMNATSARLPENCWTFPAALRRAGVCTAPSRNPGGGYMVSPWLRSCTSIYRPTTSKKRLTSCR
jgi:hypothetical protein